MQRIDDSTYIDDSLLTCSEYQLFIYDARIEGAYFHLDHWKSHKFLKGRALEPVLGVRFYDARAFCRWLTYRDDGIWSYRLPYVTETDNYPIRSGILSYMGYWALNAEQKPQFVWVDEPPSNPRKINIEKFLAHLQVQNSKLSNSRIRLIVEIYDKLRIQPLDLDLAKTRKISQSLASAIDEYISLMRSYTMQDSESVLNHALDLALENDLETFLDLLTLRERIAGRSPAFEGIRLVKERIR